MQGSFAKKRGAKWTAYYYVLDAQGRRRQRSKGGFPTKAKALGYLTNVTAALQRDEFVEPSKLSLREYLLDRWLPTMEHQIRPSTFDSYQRICGNHIIPLLGGTRLQQLSAEQLDHFYRQLLTKGSPRRPQGLAPKTVRYVHTVLHKALKDAERKQLVNRNVARAADPPKLRAAQDLRTWTAAELKFFLDHMRSHRLYAAYVLAATTGMRRGEVLGLRWSDVDFQRRRIAVRQTLLSINYELVFGTPKTSRGRRSIAIDPATAAALQQHRAQQRAERVLLGEGYRNYGLVFAQPEGEPIHPDFFSQVFDRTVARLALPKIRLHDLRHTHATLGLAAGVPAKLMSDRLGHSTVAFTQDVYMHAIPELEVDVADRVAALVFGTSDE